MYSLPSWSLENVYHEQDIRWQDLFFILSFFLLDMGITNVNIGFGGWVVCLETVVSWRFCSVVAGEFCFMEIDLNLLIRN